jgi:7-carboxy-7-deazaguanine synthase
MPIRICELYSSIQGEGILTGRPSIFVRTSGCNLRCTFCDTPFASWNPEGELQSVEAIVEQVLAEQPVHVVITGGEPMICHELPELCQLLRENGRHITIETAGTVHQSLACDLMSISPKMANSRPSEQQGGSWRRTHESRRYRPAIVRQLIEQTIASGGEYQLKFVVDTPDDLDEILAYVDDVQPSNRERVLLMPQGIDNAELDRRAEWLIPKCAEHGFRYCDRSHVRWFGNRRAT